MKTGIIGQRPVQIINVSLKMAVVMELHGFFIDIRLQRLISIWQWGIGKWIMISKISQGEFPYALFLSYAGGKNAVRSEVHF